MHIGRAAKNHEAVLSCSNWKVNARGIIYGFDIFRFSSFLYWFIIFNFILMANLVVGACPYYTVNADKCSVWAFFFAIYICNFLFSSYKCIWRKSISRHQIFPVFGWIWCLQCSCTLSLCATSVCSIYFVPIDCGEIKAICVSLS